MTNDIRSHSWLSFLVALALPSLVAPGCGDGGGETIVLLDAGGPSGCVARVIPADEPDLIGTPQFADDFAISGFVVEAEIGVNSNTRNVEVALRNIFRLDNPPAATVTEQTSGSDEMLLLEFPTEDTTEGRFFMDIALCPGDCDEKRFVYTLDPDDIRTPYVRIVFERNTEVARTDTCIMPPTVFVD